MPFNTVQFFIFFAAVFILYWGVCNRSRRLQNIATIIASYVFYAWWDWRFLFLLIFSSLICWACGLAISKYRETAPRKATVFNSLNIIINIGILVLFKYYNFFAQSFSNIFLGGNESDISIQLILPVGISFYTFKVIAYTIEIRRGTINAERGPITILNYAGFFPQLLAGPIERPQHLIPQFKNKREFSYKQAVEGCRQILWGLFKKVVVADNCAIYVNEVWGNHINESGSSILLATILFSIQIYGDFSGYSDISIGIGRLMGFSFKKNFDLPYFSRSIAEFWRKWHISLTSWFRDYIYIPMGGNRCSKGRIIVNTLTVFLLSGLWHGAGWSFIIWGGFNGLLLIPSIFLKNNKKAKGPVAQGKILPSIKEASLMLFTFAIISVGWVFFRADSLPDAISFLSGITSRSLLCTPKLYKIREVLLPMTVGIFFMFTLEWKFRERDGFLSFKRPIVRWFYYYFLIFLVLRYNPGNSDFIYFQF